MARGYDQHYGRKLSAASLGRSLARRAGNACGLCRTATSLQVIEVPPLPEEPEVDSAVMLCARCAEVVTSERNKISPDELRFLGESVWSDIEPVQIVAVRVLRRLSEREVLWARDLLDGLYLSPEVEARL